jgi:hypothetical protein
LFIEEAGVYRVKRYLKQIATETLRLCQENSPRIRSHHAVIRVYDESGNVIATHEHADDFKE